MEQKAKKRLNVIDIIAIVVILAAVLFVGYKMMDRGGETVQQAFNEKAKDNTMFLPGIMSRKKQVIPTLSALWG